MKFYFRKLLQSGGWRENVSVETDETGKIVSIEEHSENASGDFRNYAVPGFPNAHSHSFQYAMAGLAENHFSSGRKSDFWSWREAMYRLALAVDPEQLERIAWMLYSELLRHGFTSVAEFHYLHHDKNGAPYDDPAETGARLVSAARRAGIGITLVPIFYQRGGFGKPPEENQKRFISRTIEDYRKLFEASEKACRDYERARVAVGIHSLRGVEAEAITDVIEGFPQNVPFHMHISEQIREVEDSVEFLGARPVGWMLERFELSERFHFVHATHLDEFETKNLAARGVFVVLCPTTEGNLGDGIFPLREFQKHGGTWSIGTDSHVSLDFFEELRLLDYGQRLTTHRRDTFASEEFSRNNRESVGGESGLYAFRQAIFSGRKALGDFEGDFFEVGSVLDACLISDEHPLIRTASNENLLNTIIYSSDESMLAGTIAGGELVVENGRHRERSEIFRDFTEVIGELKNR